MVLRTATIEQRILLRKKRRIVGNWKQGLRKRLTVILPAQEAKTGQPLAPILGQVQVLVSDFVNTFNDKSAIYKPGLPLFVEIFVSWDKSYTLNFLPMPFIPNIIPFVFLAPIKYKNDPQSLAYCSCISLSDLYKILLLYKTKYFNIHLSNHQCLLILLSLLRNLDICVHLYSFERIKEYIIFFFLPNNIYRALYLCSSFSYATSSSLTVPKITPLKDARVIHLYRKRLLGMKKSKKKGKRYAFISKSHR